MKCWKAVSDAAGVEVLPQVYMDAFEELYTKIDFVFWGISGAGGKDAMCCFFPSN